MGLFGGGQPKGGFAMKMPQVIEAGQLAQQALEQWLGFRRFFMKAFTDEPISVEDDSAFLEVKKQITSSLRSLGARFSDKDFYFGGDKANGLLRQCVSVGQLRSLPLADRRALYKDWHVAFVHLQRTVGAFKFLSEGYIPPPKKAGGAGAGTSIASIKSAGVQAGKKK